MPIVKLPYGRITAIDLTTGIGMWMVPNGDTPDYQNHPALAGVTIPPRDATSTSVCCHEDAALRRGLGRLAVLPGSGGPMFRALDKKTGRTIFEFRLPANQSDPMSYLANNRQFIGARWRWTRASLSH